MLDGDRSLYRITDEAKCKECLNELKKRVHLEKAANRNNNDAQAIATKVLKF